MRKTPWFLAVSAVLVFPLGATISAGSAEAAELRVGFTQDALTLDPANHRKRETETIIRNLYDGVMTQTADGRAVPELAESFRQIDSLTYEAKLRRNVKFHSGDPMTAADIKFTFDRLTKEKAMGGQTSPRQSLLGPLADVLVIDDYTVHFKLKAPWPVFPRMLPVQEVVSKKFVEKVGHDALATQVNGTGPFKLVEWRRGDSIIMERFADYYGGAAAIPPVGAAKADRVIFKIIPENASRVAALLAGEVDIINEVPIHTIGQIDRSGKAKVVKANGTRTFFIALNVTRPPLNDLRVRQAANHAIDKKTLIDKLLGGAATSVAGVLSPESFGYKPGLREYAFDPEKAKSLLAQAGHANGLDVVLDTEGAFKDQAEAIASMLTKVGIRTKVQVWEGAVLTPIWRGEKKERDMYLTSWGSSALDPTGIFVPTLRTKDRGNSSGYSNPNVDRLLDAAETELDVEKRAGMYHEAEKIVAEEAPWIFLWVPQDIYAVGSRLRGWEPGSDSRINLHRAYFAN
ncbi:MAG: ABC transporter substrate-binding protein [Proteobacteria bacterium]|nr:ABC transporter substrate-binding protein [Pseudomonadota bacterium]